VIGVFNRPVFPGGKMALAHGHQAGETPAATRERRAMLGRTDLVHGPNAFERTKEDILSPSVAAIADK